MSIIEAQKIQVDLDALTIGDLVLFDAFKTNSATQAELVAFLDRVVIGGARSLPLARFKEVVEAIADATKQLANPTDGQGKA